MRRALGIAAAMLLVGAGGRTPDFQGVWDYGTATPLERTKAFENRAFFTSAEAREFVQHLPEHDLDDLPDEEKPLQADIAGDLSTVERGPLDPTLRTSILVDPPNGKLPRRTEAAKARRASREKARLAPDGPEELEVSGRCLPDVGGPPILPGAYNNHVQIVQTRDYIVIATEMINEPRIIPIGRPHAPARLRKWNGDSVAAWDGETLVIDTTNFADRFEVGGPSPAAHVVERLTRTGRDTLKYEFRVDDAWTFYEPWAGEYTFRRTGDQMFEFACHEGNYSAAGMLRGARAQDTPRN